MAHRGVQPAGGGLDRADAAMGFRRLAIDRHGPLEVVARLVQAALVGAAHAKPDQRAEVIGLDGQDEAEQRCGVGAIAAVLQLLGDGESALGLRTQPALVGRQLDRQRRGRRRDDGRGDIGRCGSWRVRGHDGRDGAEHGISAERFQQRLQPLAIDAPASHRVGKERLPDLDQARRVHRPLGRVE
jgi:hypothetical protein